VLPESACRLDETGRGTRGSSPLGRLGHLFGDEVLVPLLARPEENKRAVEGCVAGERLMHARSICLSHSDQIVHGLSRRQARAAALPKAMNAKGADVELADDHAHSTDVIGIRMRDDRQVDSVGVEVAANVIDKRLTVLLEAGVDDHVCVAPVGPREPHRDRVAVASALANRQEDVTATKTADTAFLTATGEVAGAGTTATATLAANAEVTTGCINRGSKDQQPSGLQRTETAVSGQQTFNTRSGRGTFNVSTDPITTNRACPDQMVPVLVSVTFTDVTLTITSGPNKSLTATFPDIDP
jgi:hypothetical protein